MPWPEYHYEGWTYSVYAISDGHGNIKFGVSSDVGKRIRNLQIGNAHPLQLLFECVCESLSSQDSPKAAAHFIEKWIHNEVSECQMAGEWFALDYWEAHECMCDAVEDCTSMRNVLGVRVHDVYVHTSENQHVWYWPTSDIEQRGLA
jgi:hypothetical protein